MGLGSQVHYGIRLMFAEYAIQVFAVADVDVLEGITLVFVDRLQRLEVTRVSQLVDVDDRIGGVGNDVPYDC